MGIISTKKSTMSIIGQILHYTNKRKTAEHKAVKVDKKKVQPKIDPNKIYDGTASIIIGGLIIQYRAQITSTTQKHINQGLEFVDKNPDCIFMYAQNDNSTLVMFYPTENMLGFTPAELWRYLRTYNMGADFSYQYDNEGLADYAF